VLERILGGGRAMKHFTARHPKTLLVLDLTYMSLKEAQKHNPGLIEWKEVL